MQLLTDKLQYLVDNTGNRKIERKIKNRKYEKKERETDRERERILT